jgi:hypothetical protein
MKYLSGFLFFTFVVFYNPQLDAQEEKSTNEIVERLEKDNENLGHRLDVIEKKVDDII